MKFTLRQLQVFLQTARFENISRAAESLSMSQSAASGALLDLESRYELRLFDRQGKKLRLNANGEALRPLAEALISQAQELENTLTDSEPSGTLRVGATLTIGNYVAIPIVAKFRQLYPRVDLRLHVANTEHIVQELLNYEMDVGLIEGEIHNAALEVSAWRDDELVAFCAPGHFLAKQSQLHDDDLLSVNWILREMGSGTRQAFDHAMQGILANLQIHMELEHTEAIKRAVEAGMGIGCLSRIALADAFKRGSLVPLEIPHRDMRRHFYLVKRRDKYPSRTMQAWIACCQ